MSFFLFRTEDPNLEIDDGPELELEGVWIRVSRLLSEIEVDVVEADPEPDVVIADSEDDDDGNDDGEDDNDRNDDVAGETLDDTDPEVEAASSAAAAVVPTPTMGKGVALRKLVLPITTEHVCVEGLLPGVLLQPLLSLPPLNDPRSPLSSILIIASLTTAVTIMIRHALSHRCPFAQQSRYSASLCAQM